jgi:hypothetical protein
MAGSSEQDYKDCVTVARVIFAMCMGQILD